MPRKGHSEEQIVYALRQVEGGQKVSEVCREMGVSPQAFYRWKRRSAPAFCRTACAPNSLVLGAECRAAGTIWLGQRPIIQTPWRVFLTEPSKPFHTDLCDLF